MRGGPDSLEHIYGNCIVVVIFPPCCHFKKSTFNCEFLCVQSRVIVWLAGSFHHKFFPQLGQWHERYTGETKGHVLRHVGCRHDEKMMPFQSMPICLAPVHVRCKAPTFGTNEISKGAMTWLGWLFAFVVLKTTRNGAPTPSMQKCTLKTMSTDWCPQPQMQHSNIPTNTPKMKVSLHFCCNMFLAGRCQQQRAQTHWSRMFIHKFNLPVWLSELSLGAMFLHFPNSGSMLVFHGLVRQACLSLCSLGICIKKIFEKCLQMWNEWKPPFMSTPLWSQHVWTLWFDGCGKCTKQNHASKSSLEFGSSFWPLNL